MGRKSTKLIIIFFLIALCIFTSISCSLINEFLGTTGTITGKATYSNNTSHKGIVLSLESREGDITRSVAKVIADGKRDTDSKSLTDQTTTNTTGEYQFIDVPEGDYTLYASSEDSSEKAVFTTITVEKGKAVTAPDLQLTAVGSISGRIVLNQVATGNAGFIVFIANTSYIAITGDEGDFTISNVPVGTDYNLIIMKGTDTYYWDSISVSSGLITELGTQYVLSEDFPGLISIIWKGALDNPPNNPGLYWSYFNTNDGNSYIYNGLSWDLLAQAGVDGSSVFYVKYLSTLSESGDIPAEIEFYKTGDTVTVLGNTGELERTGYEFSSWNTEADGSGDAYQPDDTLIIGSEHVTLYAIWEEIVEGVYAIGDTGPAGGMIFYIDEDDEFDWTYLESAPAGWYDTDSDPGSIWGSDIYIVGSEASGQAIGDGVRNTASIVEFHDKLGVVEGYPGFEEEWGSFYDNPVPYFHSGWERFQDSLVGAKLCRDFSLEKDGIVYDDWFLPSKGELELMYLNLFGSFRVV
jgi:hypothetical protein